MSRDGGALMAAPYTDLVTKLAGNDGNWAVT